MNEAKTCGNCELSERATVRDMTAFLWCSINVHGMQNGGSKLAHYLNPNHVGCDRHEPRVTPLPPEPDFEDLSAITQETLDQELGNEPSSSDEEAFLPEDPRGAPPAAQGKKVPVGLEDPLFKEFFL